MPISRANSHSRNMWAVVAGIVLLGVLLRLYGITSPLVDALQIKQAHTAMIARNLFYDGMNILCTRFDHIKGCIGLEFPLMHSMTAQMYYVFGVQEIIGRLINVAFSAGSMFAMYALARRFLPTAAALAALGLYMLSPTNIYVSRAFMVEPSMMFFEVSAVYLFLRWLEDGKWTIYVFAVTSAALAFLVKPTAAIIFVPVMTAWFLKNKWKMFCRFDFWLCIVLTMTPVLLWMLHANYINFNNPDMPITHKELWWTVLLGRGSILYHLTDVGFYLKMGGWNMSLLTPLGFIGMVAGCFFIPHGDQRKILYAWLGAILAFFIVFAGANRGHPYYQLHLLPPAAILFGFALKRILDSRVAIGKMVKGKLMVVLVVLAVVLIVAAYGIGYVKYFSYMYDTSLRMPYALEVSKIVQGRTPSNAIVLLNQPGAITGGPISYYSKRTTWEFGVESDEKAIAELERQRARGATTYVAIDTIYGSGVQNTKSHESFWRYLNDKYNSIVTTDHYLIFDLIKSAGMK